MANLKCSRNTSFAFFMIFFVFFIISFGTPFWVIFIFYDDDMSLGLWQQCSEDGWWFFSTKECIKLQEVSSRLKGVRATMCMALICHFASMIMYSVWISKGLAYLRAKGAGPTGIAALSLSLFGGILTIISVAVYGPMASSQHLHWSFGLAVTSGCVNIINASITLAVTACCHNDNRDNRTTQHTTAMTTMPANTVVVVADSRQFGYQQQQQQGYPQTAYPLQPGYQPQQGYPQTGYQPQPGYPLQAGYQPQPGSPPQSGYQPQPGYPPQPQPGYPPQPQPGYPPQSGYQPQPEHPQQGSIPPLTQTASVEQSSGEPHTEYTNPIYNTDPPPYNPNPPPYNPYLPTYNPNPPEPALSQL